MILLHFTSSSLSMWTYLYSENHATTVTNVLRQFTWKVVYHGQMNIRDWLSSHNHEHVSFCWVCGTVWLITGGLLKFTIVSLATHLMSFPVLETYTIYTQKPVNTINGSHNAFSQSWWVTTFIVLDTKRVLHSWWLLVQQSKFCH